MARHKTFSHGEKVAAKQPDEGMRSLLPKRRTPSPVAVQQSRAQEAA
jgi:hypothetical protein